jgi:CBS domain-containing protein
MPENTTNSTLFLDAFTEIELKLKELCKVQFHLPFLELVHKAQWNSPVVKKYANDLREFAELRNAIIHTRRDDYVIAEPHTGVVNEIVKIKDMLYDPPRVSRLTSNNIYTVTPSAPLTDLLKTFATKNIMRCPVIDKQRIVALISAKTLAYCFAAKYPLKLTPDTPVSEILSFTDPADFSIISLRTNLFEVYDQFKKSLKSGKNLQAILITNDGSDKAPVLGIVTPSDLPGVFDMIGGV